MFEALFGACLGGHRKRSPKEVWRLVDAGGSDSSTAESKANPVSKLATRTSDAR